MKTKNCTAVASLLFLLSSFIFNQSIAQSLYRIPIEQKINGSSVIVEGSVINQKSFWNHAHTMIYTSSTIEVYKEFKGTSSAVMEVVTVGGQVGNEIIQASDLLDLSIGKTGVFFLYPNSMHVLSPVAKSILFDVYSSQQGFIEYDLSNQSASTVFTQYGSITSELYPQLRKNTGRSYIDKKPSFKVNALAPAAPTAIAAISSFSPATVTAGTVLDPANNVLTINGSGFGTGGGTAAILFDNPDNGSGGAAFVLSWNDPFVISWTDTRIDVRVPTRAGTGFFQVRDALNNLTTSGTPLQVLYSVAAANVSGNPKEFRLANLNGSGGYTIRYSTNIAGTPSHATFQRALTTWKEICGFNVMEGSNTAIQAVAGDGVNVVMLDNAGTGAPPLPAGVLGVCYGYYALCGGATMTDEVLKSEFDIVIRNPGFSTGSTTFAIGPCSPNSIDNAYADLETVILHELGHAINLGHIIDTYQGSGTGQENPVKLMHYAMLGGTKRSSPDYAAKTGADYCISPRSISFGGCVTEMGILAKIIESKDNCPSSFPSTSIAPNTSVIFDLNHATSNRFVDPNFNQVRCDAIGTDVTNNAYYAFKTNSSGGIITLNVTGYNTTPSAQSACTSAYGGVLVTGVRLALYQASSCPLAQSFPAPVACRTITADGTLPDISGLAPNSNYLLYAGGIDNTKANFTVTFSGTALLPININDFHGVSMKDHNLLNWIIDYAYNVKTIHLERSNNGVHFTEVGDVTTSLIGRKGQYKDVRPLVNTNYYRLAITNYDGSKEYSKIILLTRNDVLLVNVFPNPAKDFLNIEVNTAKPEKFNIQLYNTGGQLLISKQIFASGSNQIIRIPVSNVASGQYHVIIYGEQNKVVKRATVTIQ
jgi:Secretion system C-terminal sorting domain